MENLAKEAYLKTISELSMNLADEKIRKNELLIREDILRERVSQLEEENNNLKAQIDISAKQDVPADVYVEEEVTHEEG